MTVSRTQQEALLGFLSRFLGSFCHMIDERLIYNKKWDCT